MMEWVRGIPAAFLEKIIVTSIFKICLLVRVWRDGERRIVFLFLN